jgi:cytochrome c oxidase cbb3-type subunit III
MTIPGALKPSARAARVWITLIVLLLAAAAIVEHHHLRRDRLAFRLLATEPDAVTRDQELLSFAVRQATPLYVANCARCHGVYMTGNPILGAPNLADKVWLYGTGSVADIERTLVYGIRSGHGKSRNVTDMPAFGSTGVLSASDVHNVVQYVLQLSHRPYQAAAANEGRAVYHGRANCGDCHGDDARGNPDYGAPDLTVNVWNAGGDPQALYNAVYFGQHRIMPAWIGTLSLEQIRALAVYVYSVAHPP